MKEELSLAVVVYFLTQNDSVAMIAILSGVDHNGHKYYHLDFYGNFCIIHNFQV